MHLLFSRLYTNGGFMSFDVDVDLSRVVGNFSWNEQKNQNVLPIPSDDLNKRVSELASKKIIAFKLQTTQIEQLESIVNELVTLRNKFDIYSIPDSERDFLSRMDDQIAEKQSRLEELRRSVKIT
jgi:hypothetical protein